MILPFLPLLITATTSTRSTTSSFIVIKILLIYVIKSETTFLDETPILIAGNHNFTKVTILKNGALQADEHLPIPEGLAAPERMDDSLPIFPERQDAVYFIVAGKFIFRYLIAEYQKQLFFKCVVSQDPKTPSASSSL